MGSRNCLSQLGNGDSDRADDGGEVQHAYKSRGMVNTEPREAGQMERRGGQTKWGGEWVPVDCFKQTNGDTATWDSNVSFREGACVAPRVVHRR